MYHVLYPCMSDIWFCAPVKTSACSTSETSQHVKIISLPCVFATISDVSLMMKLALLRTIEAPVKIS